ncbi:hypothetical protein FKM82_014795 [Ascaphus truei]
MNTLTTFQAISLGILLLETVIGSLANGFMVIVNLMDLVAHGNLGSCDSILTCLGLSRFSFQWLVLLMFMLSYFFNNLANSENIIHGFQYTWLFFNNTSLWFATWLCTFYCVRIANVQSNIFVIFKSHFDRWVPGLLVATVVISVTCSAPFAFMDDGFFGNWTSWTSSNDSAPFLLASTSFYTWSILSLLGSTPPFLIFCIAACLVVDSLWKHTKRMKGHKRTGFREPSLKVHYGAVKTMGYFFLFYFFYILALNLSMSGAVKNTDFLDLICSMIIGAYPSIHSVVLILGNGKFRQISIRLLQKAKCYRLQNTLTEIVII